MEQEKLLENAGRHINCKNHLGKDFGIIYSPENVHIYDLAILFRGIHSKKKKDSVHVFTKNIHTTIIQKSQKNLSTD